MRVVIAIDSFKGSLSSMDAARAAREGVLRVFPEADVQLFPLADGGEGTTDTIVSATGGELRRITVQDPLGRPIQACYGLLNGGKTAVIEMAAAGGITLLSDEERDPMRTSTVGVGEMILDAIGMGCRHFLVGIGGSATNDGGVGMLQALGFSFLDASGSPIHPSAGGLAELASISCEHAHPALPECRFEVACDVTNPLCGELGCSAVFGPQKGATAETIPQMDKALERYAELTKKMLPMSDPNAAGAGAAGGLGFAFFSYLSASLTSGIDLVMRTIGLENAIRDADVVVTGEGRLDGQSAMGKAPIGVARLAKKHGKRVLAFSGAVTDDARLCNGQGIDAFFPILRKPCTLAEAMDPKNAAQNMSDTVEQVFRLLV